MARTKTRNRHAFSAAVLLAAGSAVLCPQAQAQETRLSQLRLETTAPQDETVTSAPPVESAATPDSTGSIFDEPAPDGDPFADAPLPSPSPRDRDEPETAAERQDAAAEQLLTGEEDDGFDRAEAIESGDAAPNPRVEPVNQRAEALQARGSTVEDNPYAPLGLRLGTFVVTPSLEQGIGWTSNADSSPGGSSAFFSETTLRLNAISDWSRHSAALNAYGTFRKSISGQEISDPEAGIDGNLVLDLGHELRALASIGYQLRPESAASPVELPPTSSRPLRHLLTGSLGLEKHSGKLLYGLRGAVERVAFGDVELEGGGRLSQRERNSTVVSAVLRTGYEISPALTPFVEVEAGRRIHDLTRDTSGFERSATRYAARAGLALDLGEKLFGEFAAGWLSEDIDDDRLDDVSGASVNADLFWSPVRGTNVGLQASTFVEGTTTPFESGSILYSGRLSVERQMRANLTGNAALGVAWRDYQGSDGHDLTLSAEAGATYWLSRYMGLTGRARHERVRSNLPDRDTDTTSVFLGLRLQR